MRFIAVFILCFFILVGIPAGAQDEGLGLGVILGEPTGLNAKLWFSRETAMDLGLAWSFVDPPNITMQVYADFLFHFFGLFQVPIGQLPLYVGAGGRVIFLGNDDDVPVNVAVRVPVGVAYLFESLPLDVFLELVPMMELFPATQFRFGGGIGIRYFF